MEEAFKKGNASMLKIHVMELEDHHAVLVSKKSTSKREYTVIISKTDIMGSRFGMCACGYPKKEGIPYDHMVAISKLGRINGLSRIVVMPHWYTTGQWHNQFPEDTFINTHKTLKSIKANLTPQNNICYCPTWAAPRRRVVQRRQLAGGVLLTISSNRQRSSAGQLNPPKHQRRREWIWKVRM
jgi:hypothetical protein